ncbi:MAG: hypothetical protein E7441_09875 [Ruminococcaceae bacterium]|nr:hypothetical protein [Oscillospiraceae bacterium]
MKRKNNKITSRILSTALALALIIAVLPAAFAADKEITMPNVFPFYTNDFHYDIDGDGTYDYEIGYEYKTATASDYAASPIDITYDKGNGNVQFYTHNTISNPGWITTSTNVSLRYEKNFIAFRLKGISEGKYNVTLISRLLSNGCKADIYLVPLPEDGKDLSGTDAQAYTENLIKDATPVISEYDFSIGTAGVENEIERQTAGFTVEEPGEYLFVIKRVGTGAGNGRGAKVVALVLEPIEEEKVTYGVFDNIDGSDAVTVQGGEDNKLFGTVTAGTRISATANDKEGYTFRHWVLGSAATGRYYSSDKTVTVNPYANISLTAVYTQNNTEPAVDLYNWNGEYIETLAASELAEKLSEVQPTMTGYTFANEWKISDEEYLTKDSEITEDTQAVAQFTEVGNYDQPVSPVGTSSTGWMRNGNHVTYSENYTFFTWLNAVGEIKAYDGEAITDRIPLAVLEKNGTNFMLEYDEGDYEVVEAGILFGSTAEVDVKGAYSKAIVKNLEKNNGHGQLTATAHPDGTEGMQSYARGYVIYDDNGTNKVVYTDAIANS